MDRGTVSGTIEHLRHRGVTIVYGTKSREGTKGVLTDAYGVYADPEVGAMLDTLPIERSDRPRG